MSDFVHLHLHTEYSLLDGACKIDRLMGRLKELGQTACAITDHGVMFGVIDFYEACKKNGIKPIIGCEVYKAPGGRADKQKNPLYDYSHLVLLAENETGYHNIAKMVTRSFTEGFYIKPRVDDELLREYSEGVICLSGCLAGEIPRAIEAGDVEGAVRLAEKYRDIFGPDNFFLEIQDHGLSEQKSVNIVLTDISKRLGIPLVATNDAHYLTADNAYAQKVLMCIQTARTVDEGSGIDFGADEFYVKSTEEMKEIFSHLPEAIENTVRIAERCNVEFEFGSLKLPAFVAPDGQENFGYLTGLCLEGLKKRYGEVTDELRERLDFELKTIKQMGYVDYFLIVRDFIHYAKSHGIPVGPGRGSAAGAVVSYCLEITDIDPIRFSLLFERFLNPERVSMPDIDIDFCYERRQEVIDYVVQKYGADHVCQIVTFGTMKARQAVRDVGRALGYPYAEVDAVAKLIPNDDLKMTIGKALVVSPDLKEQYDNSERVKRLIDTALTLEGMPRHTSIHAAGVVITDRPVADYIPLHVSDNAVVTQYPKDTVEHLGLLKMDFLGLRNLTVISDTVKAVRDQGMEFDDAVLSAYDDPDVFALMSQGNTTGVFQLESPGMRRTLADLQPQSLEDIIAVISLYRPGPMDSIPRYVECKWHPERVTYDHPLLEGILKTTYGCMVYQEQVMQMVRILAGYNYGRADLVRRVMAKKKPDKMEAEREFFLNGVKDDDGNYTVPGCLRNGIDKTVANKVFDDMSAFASYAFNKSHAACYADVAYRTAYLKLHYPAQYMAALLTSVLDSTSKLAEYRAECERLGLQIKPPDINLSYSGFTSAAGQVRFGLVAIKGIGRALIDSMVVERTEHGPFKSFFDFASRMSDKDLNKRAAEALIKCGAFDSLGRNRRCLLMCYEAVMNGIASDRKNNLVGQLSLFGGGAGASDTTPYPDVEEFGHRELLAAEKESAGMYLSGHPMSEYAAAARRAKATPLVELMPDENGECEYRDGQQVTVAGIISAIVVKTTKNDATMAFVTIEDTTGAIEILAFPRVRDKYVSLLVPDNPIVVRGKLSVREEEPTKLLADSFALLSDTDQVGSKLFIRMDDAHLGLEGRVKELLRGAPGAGTVIFYFVSDDKQYRFSQPVSLTPQLCAELTSLLGAANVVVK